MTPVAMTIATSDSGGGAGIQADLKAFARCGVHGTSAIVALTAQNTVEVVSVHTIPREIILDQIRAVASDMEVGAVKIGMLFDGPTIAAVVEGLADPGLEGVPVVVDPVMVAESGAVLLQPDAVQALVGDVFPLAAVVTPNIPEARELTGLGEEASQKELVRAVHALGPAAAIVTGGHDPAGADLFFDGESLERIEDERHPDGASHGSGCTHSSALAANLALGLAPLEAARAARAVAADAVRDGLRDVGAGAGPVDAIGIARLRS
jgi:hydroxymethylpyrimidine/phosphomethylpyrimidine kinase